MPNQAERNCAKLPRAEAIAQLNDRLRQQGQGGTMIVTRGVMCLPSYDAAALTQEPGRHSGFDAANDLHGERDFGDLALFGAELLWKIDYYDNALQYGSDDPADSSVTRRVLTVMLASEY